MTFEGVKGGWVYIMTSRPYGTLYVGVTNNLARRVWEHREGIADGFTHRYAARVEGRSDREGQSKLGRFDIHPSLTSSLPGLSRQSATHAIMRACGQMRGSSPRMTE